MRSITLEELDEMCGGAERMASELECFAAMASTSDRESLRLAEAHALALADELHRLRARRFSAFTEAKVEPISAT